MAKLKTKKQLNALIKSAKKSGKTVGIVTGSFKQMVENHSILFKFAKKHVDVLIVATGNDKVVCTIKNSSFPTFKDRIGSLEKYEDIDYLFEIKHIDLFVSDPVVVVYKKLFAELSPDFIFTNGPKDKYLKDKQQAALNTNVKIVDKIFPLNQ